MMETEKRQDWIVGRGADDSTIVFTLLKNATKQEVKKYLVKCVKKEKKYAKHNYSTSSYEFGTESVKEVKEYNDNVLDACANFSNYHLNWSAQPLCEVTFYEYS